MFILEADFLRYIFCIFSVTIDQCCDNLKV